ncbi:MAG: hypothetical protein HW380_2227 [Magnetococcales bacterium]|nr:hypothetical protein [Magnetococcales bacterium]HIJ83731.1 hypothetical protein [Magnetococcales bacterium]
METQLDLLPWTFLLLGSAMSLFGLWRILTMSLSMVLWSAMLIIGLIGVEYGLSTSPAVLEKLGISPGIMQKIGSLTKPSRDLSEAALANVCRRLDSTSLTEKPPTDPAEDSSPSRQ